MVLKPNLYAFLVLVGTLYLVPAATHGQGSHRVLAPPQSDPKSGSAGDRHEDLIREIQRFVENSDKSLDIDPEEIDPKLLEMAQRWARQFQNPDELPEEMRELVDSLSPKLRTPEGRLPRGQFQPPNNNESQQRPNRQQPNEQPNNNSTEDPFAELEFNPDEFETPEGSNAPPSDGELPSGDILDELLNGIEREIDSENSDSENSDSENSDSENSDSENSGSRNGEQATRREQGDEQPNARHENSPSEDSPRRNLEGNGEPVPTPRESLEPGDIVPDTHREERSHRSEILDGLRDSDLTIKQQWNRILEQARREAILDENPAKEIEGNEGLTEILKETFGESIAETVDRSHDPNRRRNSQSRNNQSRTRTNRSQSSERGPIRHDGNNIHRKNENPFLPNDRDNNSSNRFEPRDNGSRNDNGLRSDNNPFERKSPPYDRNSNNNNNNNNNSNSNNSNPFDSNRFESNNSDRNHFEPNQNSNNSDSNDRSQNSNRSPSEDRNPFERIPSDRNNSNERGSNNPYSPNANNRDSNRNQNSSNSNEPRKGFSDRFNDFASMGEDLFHQVANSDQSNRRENDPVDRESPDSLGTEEGSSDSAFSIQAPFMLLFGLLVLAGCALWLLKVRQQKIAVAAQMAAIATQMPTDLATRADVLDAFHAMSAKTAAAESPWWTHHRAATELYESTPHGRHALEALTTVYEQARYLPVDQPLDPNELNTARQALSLYQQ